MHTDDHILESLVAAKGPLPVIAAELRMSFIALIRWMDAHADLIAIAKRALESHIKLLSLRAEAAALIDLTNVSTSTPNEERKRKSASQLLRHTAKRLLANPERKLRAPCAPAFPPNPLHQLALSSSPNGVPSPSPRDVGGGEKYPSTEGARGMRGVPIAASANESACLSTNPERKLRAPCASESPSHLLHQLASTSSPPNAESRMPNAVSSPNAESRMPNAASSPSSLLSSCGGAPAIHPPDFVTQAVVAGLHMGMRIPGFTLADCHPP